MRPIILSYGHSGKHMNSAVAIHRLQFAFTITFHYIFPQLTMGLALLIVILKALAFFRGDEFYNNAARFWTAYLPSISLSVWSPVFPWNFSSARIGRVSRKPAGGVIGQTLAMEGVFSFFLESSFLGLLLYGEKRLGPKLHLLSASSFSSGSWLSGLLHHRDRCLDAAPHGSHDRSEG